MAVLTATGVRSGAIVLRCEPNLASTAAKPIKAWLRAAEFDFGHGDFTVPWAFWVEASTNPPHDLLIVEADAVKRFIAESRRAIERRKASAAGMLRAIEARFAAQGLRLRDYQRDGARYLASRPAAFLLDEMGLGKTVQSLAAIPPDGSAIIVCPATLKGNWLAELKRWRPDLRPTVLAGRHGYRALRGEVAILSPESLTDRPATPDRATLIVDEAHYYKGKSSTRARRMTALVKAIAASGGAVFALTGTPIQNDPLELWHLAATFGLARTAWGSFESYAEGYGLVETPYGNRYRSDPSDAIRAGLARISLRRTRAEVLAEIPHESYQFLPVTLGERAARALDGACEAITHSLDEWEWHDRMPSFADWSTVRKEVAQRKTEAAIEWVLRHEAEGLPAVVFSAHRSAIDVIGARNGWTTITGDIEASERTRRVEAFQRGNLVGIAGTIQAMGTGLTLTRAAHCLFIDRMPTPAANLQAKDRLCRHGQTKPVLITILVGDHPIERRIEEILSTKTVLYQETLRKG